MNAQKVNRWELHRDTENAQVCLENAFAKNTPEGDRGDDGRARCRHRCRSLLKRAREREAARPAAVDFAWTAVAFSLPFIAFDRLLRGISKKESRSPSYHEKRNAMSSSRVRRHVRATTALVLHGCGAGGRCRTSGVPCAGVLCNTMRHGMRVTTVRG